MSGGSVFLGNLNDFISPSQACVNPIFAEKKQNENEMIIDNSTKPKIDLVMENDLGMNIEAQWKNPDLIKTTSKNTAKVSLADCLACSGCVTSAETVLIEQQSLSKFEQEMKAAMHDTSVVTLSDQSCASIASHFRLSSVDDAKQLLRFFFKKQYGVKHVVDLKVAHAIALAETGEEFLSRYKNKILSPPWVLPPYTSPVDSNFVNITPNASEPTLVRRVVESSTSGYVPMICSSCPGWICYAEKSSGEALPYIATTKSPQQIGGSLCEAWLRNAGARSVYHTTVMPCADKKLEASRKDFYDTETDSHHVDCVLTTREIIHALEAYFDENPRNTTYVTETIPLSPFEQWLGSSAAWARTFETGGSVMGSGGYADYVYKLAAEVLFHTHVDTVPFKAGRNSDLQEADLIVEGKVVLRVATVYGFRNIQALLRQMKRNKCTYDYIEIMACPSGCLNGGGQFPAVDNKEMGLANMTRMREKLVEVSDVFHQSLLFNHEKKILTLAQLREFLGNNIPNRELFHTSYHAIPKLESGLTQTW